jgi:hypothetical protein
MARTRREVLREMLTLLSAGREAFDDLCVRLRRPYVFAHVAQPLSPADQRLWLAFLETFARPNNARIANLIRDHALWFKDSDDRLPAPLLAFMEYHASLEYAYEKYRDGVNDHPNAGRNFPADLEDWVNGELRPQSIST